MKRLKTTLIVLLCAIACKAQTDETKLQVIYNAYYLKYAEDDSLSRDIAQLDIGTNTSRYCSFVGEWYNTHPEGRAPYPGTKIKDDYVYKNMPSKGLVTAMHFPGRIVTQDSINNLFDWQLVEGDSIVCVDILATRLRPHFAVAPGQHGIHSICRIMMVLGNYAACLG